MGRYYSGDIEGKFWFGVQSSDDAVHFGAVEQEPNHIDYYVDDLAQVEAGLKEVTDELGIDEQRLDEFFESRGMLGYNDAMIVEHYKNAYDLEITERDVHNKLELLARLELGKKIHEVVKDQGYCSFTAEF